MRWHHSVIVVCVFIASGVISYASIDYGDVPIILVHGFNATTADFNVLESLIHVIRPQRLFYVIRANDGAACLRSISEQTQRALEELQEVQNAHKEAFEDGFVLMGHSLGGLIARNMLENKTLHVRHFISLAGLQNGMFVNKKVNYILSSNSMNVVIQSNDLMCGTVLVIVHSMEGSPIPHVMKQHKSCTRKKRKRRVLLLISGVHQYEVNI